MTNTLHAHLDHYSSDCDGSYSRTGDFFFNEEEVAESQKEVNDFSEIHFHDRMVSMLVNSYAMSEGCEGTLRVRQGTLEWFESTDEGRVEATVRFCTDDCGKADSTFRDHRAESMGY